MNKKYIVTLTEEERATLEGLIRTGRGAARRLAHARVLLKADVSVGGPGWSDEQISAAVEVSTHTVQRIRQAFVEQSLSAALDPRPSRRVMPTKLDGVGEAHLIALTCSQPPAGRARWTLRLLAQQMVALAYVDTLSYETVRQVLKKVPCSPGGRSSGAFRHRPTGRL